MKAKNFVIPLMYLSSIFICFQSKADNGVDFVFEAGTSHKNITFGLNDAATGQPEQFPARILTLDYAGVLLYQNFYARLKFSQSVKDDVLFGGNVIIFMTRSDIDFSLGYYIGSGVSAFAGYKYGEFTVIMDKQFDLPADFNIGISFIDRGPFAGLGYTLHLKESSLSFALAYAKMEGEITAIFANTFGNTTGISFSTSWNIPVTDSTNFTVGLNFIRYEFEDETMGLGSYLDTNQDFNNVSVGLAHYF